MGAISQIVNQLNINMTYQSLSTPPGFPTTAALFAFPLRYDTTTQDYSDLQAICESSVQ